MTIFSRIRTGVAAGAACVILAVSTPGTATAESLADAMAGAYEHSGLLDQNRALLRAADEDVAIALSKLRPIIRWSGDVTRTFGETYSTNIVPPGAVGISRTEATIGLGIELLLYDGGRTKMDVDVAKENVLATRQTLVSIEQQVLLNAVQAFMDVRSSFEIVALRRNNIRVITEELRAARDRFEVGEVTRTDVALTQARLAGARSELAQAEGDLAIAIEDYRAAVGRRPGQLTQPPVMKMPARTVEAAKEVALRTHPELRRAGHQVTAADLGIMIAEAAVAPDVRLRGGYSITERFDSDYFQDAGSVGVEVGGTIYQGGQLRALKRKAIAQRDAARGGLHDARHRIAQNVGSAFARVQVAQAALAATDEQIRAARVAFRGVREEATLGARTTLDVLNAEQELLDAQANRISAASNEYVAYYGLLASMGLLTADYLKLNVQQYDPTAYYNLVKDAPSAVSKRGQQLDRVLQKLGKQ